MEASIIDKFRKISDLQLTLLFLGMYITLLFLQFQLLNPLFQSFRIQHHDTKLQNPNFSWHMCNQKKQHCLQAPYWINNYKMLWKMNKESNFNVRIIIHNQSQKLTKMII